MFQFNLNFEIETNKVSSQSIFVFNTNQVKSIPSLTTHRLNGQSEAVVADEVEESWLRRSQSTRRQL